MRLGDTPVYKSEFTPTHYDDGRPRLFQLAPDFGRGPMLMMLPLFGDAKREPAKSATPQHWCVLVHPSRWDAFWMAVNQPDVFKHPDVQELLGITGE